MHTKNYVKNTCKHLFIYYNNCSYCCLYLPSLPNFMSHSSYFIHVYEYFLSLFVYMYLYMYYMNF